MIQADTEDFQKPLLSTCRFPRMKVPQNQPFEMDVPLKSIHYKLHTTTILGTPHFIVAGFLALKGIVGLRNLVNVLFVGAVVGSFFGAVVVCQLPKMETWD